MADIPLHHIVYGTCTDYVTGETLTDTDDERTRQQLARLLVEEKSYPKSALEMRRKIETLFAGQFVVSKVDITVHHEGRRCMIIRYAPGSLVTRERSAVAAARVLDKEYRIPLAVVTNGKDAELLDTETGEVLGTSLAAIPAMAELAQMFDKLHFAPLNDRAKSERELRILNAFDVEICCAGGPCALPRAPEGRGGD
ncbi:MAG: type I restriction enzyme HsdR N-terminal domain-containing protein [Proteobacteria bacterium]|nr:type I restriction enzyme HsdR N-terminal domain-containing protein [Pseudomonadota bacterium]MBU0967992.1 type I restriction enzyme HsdR N-terminal domain-containing protein [Pseudomonadota bacterium]